MNTNDSTRKARSPSKKINIPLPIVRIVLAIAGAVVFAALALQLLAARESERIQRGPQVPATLERQWRTETYNKYGTHYTTHFQITFTTTDGSAVTTTVNTYGTYREMAAGSRLDVRYDPSHPSHAEFPASPMAAYKSTFYFVLIMVCILAVVAVFVFWRAKRRARLPTKDRTQSSLG